jgi:GWxTD domain-containing protein
VALYLIAGCSQSKSVSKENFAPTYDIERVQMNLDYTAYHASATETEVHLQIPSNNLNYSSPDESGLQEATAVIDLKAFVLNNNSTSKKATDSLVVKIRDIQPNQPYYLSTKLSLKLPENAIYQAQLKISDINGNTHEQVSFVIDKSNHNNRQNFLLLDSSTNSPIYNSWVNQPTKVKILNNEGKPLLVRYYLRKFPLAPPPFSNYTPPPFQYEADSTFELSASSDFVEFNAKQMGFYHFVKDDSQKNGHTLFAFNENFPKVITSEQMFESLRYITTEWEYREMKQATDIKGELETFWINCAGNKDKAKELIKIYYGRVEEANRFFSSYVEGWKTDRGIIHIVYGKPNIIYQSPTSETWIYGEDKNMMSLSFTFVKVINPFTDNDFRLSRDENYKSSWYRSIESWRNGRIYAN